MKFELRGNQEFGIPPKKKLKKNEVNISRASKVSMDMLHETLLVIPLCGFHSSIRYHDMGYFFGEGGDEKCVTEGIKSSFGNKGSGCRVPLL